MLARSCFCKQTCDFTKKKPFLVDDTEKVSSRPTRDAPRGSCIMKASPYSTQWRTHEEELLYTMRSVRITGGLRRHPPVRFLRGPQDRHGALPGFLHFPDFHLHFHPHPCLYPHRSQWLPGNSGPRGRCSRTGSRLSSFSPTRWPDPCAVLAQL